MERITREWHRSHHICTKICHSHVTASKSYILFVCFFKFFSWKRNVIQKYCCSPQSSAQNWAQLIPDQTGPDLVGVTAAALVLAGAAIADWLKKWRRQRRSGDFQPISDKPLRWGVTNRVVSATFQGDNYRYRFFLFMHSAHWARVVINSNCLINGGLKNLSNCRYCDWFF